MTAVIVTSTTTRIVREAAIVGARVDHGPLERAATRLGLFAIAWAQARAEARATPDAGDRAEQEHAREAREQAARRRLAGIRGI